MKPLYSQEEFDNSKTTDKLPCECYQCGKTFYKRKKYILDSFKEKTENSILYCGNKCHGLNRITREKVICTNCGNEFERTLSQSRKCKNNFCSRSCNATYNNTHKTKGTRRSKLEIFLEKELITLYPELKMDFNKTDAINSELDIYIPSLNLSFELNGIFHYEPIYGQNKLDKVQNNDDRKIQACIEKGIEFCIIDTSQQKYFKEESSQKFLSIIISIINNKIQKQASNLQPSDYESDALPIKAIPE